LADLSVAKAVRKELRSMCLPTTTSRTC
jgi:hypothetical protein